ncbi:helix-turn-helix domain-containing protein [Nocardiopsis sp. RSe5-2]|uniref:Helix-turn-helix domain-containing protein n=1 Tax=Nocardiopsis endophytica TaxID=3018445 RepID=A0ABT4UA53_9ACTN|nr:helix-turn-helix domain-containing protein [Nocardiopsis endophytica]MDA2813825.1 helix-turn-helix domain-containing protein [Nocardiopsis endophytica]
MAEETGQCYDYVADCRLRAAFDLFAHTWDPVVLAALHEGPLRRGRLRTSIGGVSDKALTEALTRLVGHGLIERHRHREAPPRVEYGLTPLGKSLVDGPIRAMAEWTGEYGDRLAAAGAEPPGNGFRKPFL